MRMLSFRGGLTAHHEGRSVRVFCRPRITRDRRDRVLRKARSENAKAERAATLFLPSSHLLFACSRGAVRARVLVPISAPAISCFSVAAKPAGSKRDAWSDCTLRVICTRCADRLLLGLSFSAVVVALMGPTFGLHAKRPIAGSVGVWSRCTCHWFARRREPALRAPDRSFERGG